MSTKKLIFDLDNTIITWTNDYYISLDETFKELNLEINDSIKENLINAVDNYEKNYNIFKEEYMIEIMEKYTNMKLPNNFIEIWLNQLENKVPKLDNELLETLEYLNSKYELVILTNWFTKSQTARLKNYGIDKYFKEIIGTDKVLNKPYKEAFIKAIGKNNINECIMIGDSYEKDMLGAINIGMKVIYITNKKTNLNSIEDVRKLKNIL